MARLQLLGFCEGLEAEFQGLQVLGAEHPVPGPFPGAFQLVTGIGGCRRSDGGRFFRITKFLKEKVGENGRSGQGLGQGREVVLLHCRVARGAERDSLDRG
jgi:hypothetical protein